MKNTLQDVRFAFRALRKSPLFTASAIVVLALGVGLNAATFSLFDAVVLKSLPAVGRPGELIGSAGPGGSYPSFRDIREGGGGVFQGVGAWGHRWLSVAGGGAAEHLRGTLVSAEYFDVLQVPLAAGRGFVRGEEDAGDPVAVVSARFAGRRFGSAANAIGRVFLANGTPFTIVGVTPPEFRGVGFASFSEIWVPIGAWPRIATGGGRRMNILGRSWGWLSFFARSKPGVTKAQAQAAVDLLVRQETAAYPKDVGSDYAIAVRPLARSAAGAGDAADPARFLGILLGAVGVVLLIACANLANLLLARGAGRRREIAVRQALGASRGRLIRQLLTESLVLASLGGAAGLLVASWFVALLARVPIPGGATFGAFGAALDLRVLGFAFLLSLATGGLFGLVPAVKGSRVHLLPSLKDEPPPGGRRLGLNGTLMACQVALCLLLLSGAGLFVRSLRNALTADLGFQPRGVAIATVNLGLARYDGPRAREFTTRLAERAARLPGVRSAAWTGILPLSGDRDTESIRIPEATGPVPKAVDVLTVGPGYFEALEMPISAGREFDARLDLPEGTLAAVVNESAARRFWPGRSARRPADRHLRRRAGRRRRRSRFAVLFARRPRPPAGRRGRRPARRRRPSLDHHARHPDVGATRASFSSRFAARSRGSTRRCRSSTFGPSTIRSATCCSRSGSAPVCSASSRALSFVLAQIGVYAVVAGRRRPPRARARDPAGARRAPAQVRRMIVRETAASIAAGLAVGASGHFCSARVSWAASCMASRPGTRRPWPPPSFF